MKTVEIASRSRGKEWGRMMVGVNLTKVHYRHIWKGHNECPLYN
jgi:hypothetical protein